MALCQLRDRTPATDWTVLSIDTPEFFTRGEGERRSYDPVTDPRAKGYVKGLDHDAELAIDESSEDSQPVWSASENETKGTRRLLQQVPYSG